MHVGVTDWSSRDNEDKGLKGRYNRHKLLCFLVRNRASLWREDRGNLEQQHKPFRKEDIKKNLHCHVSNPYQDTDTGGQQSHWFAGAEVFDGEGEKYLEAEVQPHASWFQPALIDKQGDDRIVCSISH